MPASADRPCDALVLFGATGDLAAKMIFPALARLSQHDGLELPVIAVGHHPLDAAALAASVREHIAGEAPSLTGAFDAVARRLTYVHGDLSGTEVYARIREALRAARRPLHYLAVPPGLFEPVIRGLARAALVAGTRIAIEKPFGHDLASARALQRVVEGAFTEPQVWRIDHYLAKDPVRNVADMRASTAWLEPLWSQQHVRSVQITMAEAFGIAERGAFYEATGALRDVFQSHLLQLVALVAMEAVPPGAVRVALDTHRLAAGSDAKREPVALAAALPDDEDRDAYVNILRALVHGERAIAERATGVTAAWRVVDDILRAPLPVHRYAPGSFGPAEAERLLAEGERWLDPAAA